MNIEAVGSIGSALGSVASAVGRGASSVGPLTTIVNEGPVGLADLKATVPLKLGQINPVSELRFDSPVPKSNILIGEGTVVEPRIIREATYWFTDVEPKVVKPAGLEYPKPQVAVSPAWAVQSALQSKTESRVSAGSAQTVSVQPTTESQEKKEEVLDEKVVKENPKEVLQEEEIADKKAYLEDEEASGQRRHEVREATVEAKVEADRLGLKKITGRLVARFLPAEHEGNRSQVVKNQGPDGSYQETVEAIAGVGELESEERAVERFDEIVAEKKPVKLGKNGTPVRNEDVARVFKYKTVKPAQAYIEVIKRFIKKTRTVTGQPLGVNTIPPQGWTEVVDEEVKTESSLENYPELAEVFKKF